MNPLFNQNNDINAITKELKKSSLSFTNRLQSIIHDAKFVNLVQQELQLPLIANERCGLWYIPPNERTDTCYFKSTDGHTNVWSFSLRRLNLHLLPIINDKQGIIIVDSTRRGKPMPDALLKTIPIWCAVVNTIFFGESQDGWLRTPSIVPRSEHNSIEKLIPEFVKSVRELNLFGRYTHKLNKPLIPRFFYPGCASEELDDNVFNICCVSVSKQVPIHKTITTRGSNGDMISFDYVQGSADDHELWVPKALPEFDANYFWQVKNNLIDPSTGYIPSWRGDDELVKIIQGMNKSDASSDLMVQAVGETEIYFGCVNHVISFDQLPFNTVILHDNVTVLDKNDKSTKQVLQYQIPNNKKGSNMLRSLMPEIIAKIDLQSPISILCGTGKDLSVGLVLILLCLNFNLDWKKIDDPPPITKTLIKQHLGKLSNLYKVNPQRSTLQSINSYLFSQNT
ncbi:RIT1 [Candida margitis]|uniref:RIT1 n=1 Tax=Candida margitis TaxID=1775924 RepID=UPI0022270285|nr:RIT1 [Candida margitis]KAI5969075.1 RIT1 [Candida margitis]